MPAERWSAVDGRRLDFKALEEASDFEMFFGSNVFFFTCFRSVLFPGSSGFESISEVDRWEMAQDYPRFCFVEGVFFQRSSKTIFPTTHGFFFCTIFFFKKKHQASAFFYS